MHHHHDNLLPIFTYPLCLLHQSSLFHFSLFSVLSEQELDSKRATVAELSRRLQWSRQIFFWPEKIEPIFTQLFLEHHTKLARKAIETVV